MIPGGFALALDWLYSTRTKWRRHPAGSVQRLGFLAVAVRLTELSGRMPRE